MSSSTPPGSPRWSETPLPGSSRRVLCVLVLQGLDRLEALEFRMTEVKRLAVTGRAMRGAKLLRPRPVLERVLVRPHRMRGIERIVVAIGPTQKIEFDEARQLIEIRVPTKPTALELLLVALDDLEAIHCDVHLTAPLRLREQSAHFSAYLIVIRPLTVMPGLGSTLRNCMYSLLSRLFTLKFALPRSL